MRLLVFVYLHLFGCFVYVVYTFFFNTIAFTYQKNKTNKKNKIEIGEPLRIVKVWTKHLKAPFCIFFGIGL